jgi:hypothetical protein
LNRAKVGVIVKSSCNSLLIDAVRVEQLLVQGMLTLSNLVDFCISMWAMMIFQSIPWMFSFAKEYRILAVMAFVFLSFCIMSFFMVSNPAMAMRLFLLISLLKFVSFFYVSIAIPVLMLIVSHRRVESDELSGSLLASVHCVYSLESLLKSLSGMKCFRQFMMEEGYPVEILLCWIDVCIIKKIKRRNFKKVRSIALYKQFLDPDSQLLISAVPLDMKQKVFHELNETSLSGDALQELERYLFDVLNREFYPKFLESRFSQDLMSQLEKEEMLHNILQVSEMI